MSATATDLSRAEHHTAADLAARQRLKSRIERTVTLVTEPLELGGRHFDWYRVANPDVLLQSAAKNSTQPAEELDPFWAATWRAAIGLDRFLQRLPLADVRVLELGCGSGQAGIGAAAQQAQVTMTDAVGLALMVARLNAWPLLSSNPMTSQLIASSPTTHRPNTGHPTTSHQQARIHFQRLRWTIDQLTAAPFPIIIGSDIVYDPNLFPLLNQCARQHLAEGGRMYLSEPHRHTGDRFSTFIRTAGWQTTEHDIDLQDHRIPIRIFECWR